jgi:hypothetical protein
VTQFGINRSVHFKVKNEEIRNKIGLLLAPLEPWGDWGSEISKAPRELRGGMISLSVQESQTFHDFRRKTTAIVQPSTSVSHACGIFVTVNDHYEPIGRPETEKVLDTLNECFEKSLDRSRWIMDKVEALENTIDV